MASDHPDSLKPNALFIETFLNLLIDQGIVEANKLKYAQRVQTKLESSKPILVLLSELGYVTHDQLVQALQNHPIKTKLGNADSSSKCNN